MRTSKVITTENNWEVEVLVEGHEPSLESLEDLMKNHMYNLNTDWEAYRKTGNLWRKKKQTS